MCRDCSHAHAKKTDRKRRTEFTHRSILILMASCLEKHYKLYLYFYYLLINEEHISISPYYRKRVYTVNKFIKFKIHDVMKTTFWFCKIRNANARQQFLFKRAPKNHRVKYNTKERKMCVRALSGIQSLF